MEKITPQERIRRALLSWLGPEVVNWLASCFAGSPVESRPKVPARPMLDEKEKVKMDYGFHLKWKEIALDKLCFTVVGAVIAGSALWLANFQLEKYKLAEANQRFFTEKRLEMVVNINSAMSDVTGVYFAHAGETKVPDQEVIDKEFEQALTKGREVINRSEFFFGENFRTDIDRYYQVLRAMSHLPVGEWGKYRKFLSHLVDEFEVVCKEVVLHEESSTRMTLANISYEKRIELTPKQYLDEHFENWKSRKPNAN